MDGVIDLAAKRAERQADDPHISGEAKCLSCAHEWVAVAPVGANDLDCPKCETHRGVWKWPLLGTSGYVWLCNCGNDLFRLTPHSAICCKCGAMPEDWKR